MSTIRVALSKLIPGMQVADDVYNRDAQLIVPKGVSLTDRILNRLKYYSIETVVIYLPEGYVPEPDELMDNDTNTPEPKAAPEFKTHSQKIRERNFSNIVRPFMRHANHLSMN